ncbi:MAG: type I restriction-modification system subunit M N-terminal domain-containing protein [Luteolibacter sp.]
MHWNEPATSADSHAELERKLWDAANMLWAGADQKPSEYSPSVLGLIFLRYADVKFAACSGGLRPSHSSRSSVPAAKRKPATVTDCRYRTYPPNHGRIFDPACGSGGMFIQAARFVEAQDSAGRFDFVMATAKCGSAFSHAKPHRRADRRPDNPPFNVSEIDTLRSDINAIVAKIEGQ